MHTELLSPNPAPAGLSTYTIDHYAALGVDIEAGMAEIRAAYLRLARIHHPDRGGADQGGANRGRFFARHISPAYAVLSRPEARREYDESLQAIAQRASRTDLRAHPFVALLGRTDSPEALVHTYRGAVAEHAGQPCADHQTFLGRYHELSQLNLAFLLRRRALLVPPASTASTSVAWERVRAAVSTVPDTACGGTKSPWFDRHLQRGQQHLMRRQFREALASFNECLRLEPGNADVHAHIGMVLVGLGKHAAAREKFSLALKLDPDNATAAAFEERRAHQLRTERAGRQQTTAGKQEPVGLLDRVVRFLNSPVF